MKKLLIFAVVMAAVAVLGSCSESNSPKATAEKSMECLKNKDFQGYTDLLYFNKETLKDPEKVKQEKDTYRALLQKAFSTRTEGKGDIKEYSFVSEDVKDSVAVVKMAVVSTTNDKDTVDVKLRKDDNGEWKLDSKK